LKLRHNGQFVTATDASSQRHAHHKQQNLQ
jgi:hypothetical protein